MNKSISVVAAAIACLMAGSVAGPAMARGGGSMGMGGHMPGTLSSGAMSTPATHVPSAQTSTPSTSSGVPNPNAGSNSSNVFRSLDSPIPGLANTPNP
jgi:hypothetical protein